MSLEHTNILIELNKAVKTLNFYPQGHPNLDNAIKNFHSSLQKETSQKGQFTWNADKKGISIANVQLSPGNAVITGLAKLFFYRKIRMITITPDVSIEDVKTLAGILAENAEDVFAKGGVERILAKSGVKGILLNEMSYKDLAELKEKIEEEEKIKEEEKEKEEKSEELAEEDVQEEEEEDASPEETEEEKSETLEALVKKLEKETDAIFYNDIASRVCEKLDAVYTEKNFDRAIPGLIVFGKHTFPDFAPDGGIRRRAGECLSRFLTVEALSYMVKRIGGKEEPLRPALIQLIIMSGETGASLMITELVETNEAQARRILFNTLVRFGEKIRPLVETKMTSDARWFAIRQMVALLGAVGGPKAIPSLEAAYNHADVRVKKEVLKSLSMIHSPKSTELLFSALKEKSNDKSLMGQAIISLGVLKEGSAVDTIGEIALRKEAFSDDIDLQREAIKALGMIRDDRSIQYLKKVLFRTAWFGKDTNEELRTLAALSLGKIDSPEAKSALDEVCKDSSGKLYNACKRIHEGTQK
ncbi:MAG: HEAT repeat domain-containing protein [Thermodesulfobacteriota bacterium]